MHSQSDNFGNFKLNSRNLAETILKAGLGSILDTVSEDLEDAAYLYLLNVS